MGKPVVILTRLFAAPLLFLPLFAQPQIGGGFCTSAILTGNYSLTLTGRQVSSGAMLNNVSQGVGTANFDGLSKVTFTLTSNTLTSAGISSTLSGTYSFQANCEGSINITSGDTATFTLASYDQGKSYVIAGFDAAFDFTGSGSTLPGSCSASLLSGTYSFNATGFETTTSGVSGADDISGTIQFDGISAVNITWYISSNGAIQTFTSPGAYTVSSGCTGSATVTNTASNTYILNFTLTSATNFAVIGSGPRIVFTGSGRIL